MSLNLDLNTPLTSLSLIRPNLRRRSWQRRRLKTTPIRVSSELGDLFSNIRSINPFGLVFPAALGFVSGAAAVSLYRIRSDGGERERDLGEWALFTSPTPFNRFAVLRCPSLSNLGNELLEEVNEKLVKEDNHFVRLDSGRILVRNYDNIAEEKIVYQRVCLNTDDGGVLSLDWPANLELTEEYGFDTTLLLIPGNSQGSMDKNVRSFVRKSLRCGFFPVVMNPRGCAGSPLTTARLFTAADSDDISAAVQYVSRTRPWTTMMGVGWGYGANMLAKYLAEVGECTPFTAATCIDNPFDLETATRPSRHPHFDRELTSGLVDILKSNKELFRGRIKGFEVEKALVANSVRDFEKAISMRSYGYEAIEDFYENSSTRSLVGKVKIPILFIQNDGEGAPLFSVPRNLIAENPFTSLLLCSCSSTSFANRIPAINWCHHLTIEWLAAVELGLLKGRHPLLKDIDISINPSKGLATLTSGISNRHGKSNKLVNSPQLDSSNGYLLAKHVGESDTSAGISSKLTHKSQKIPELIEDEAKPEDDRGQVIQAAQVIINMLDVTMPDTLTEEQKKKVLTAVGQGETVMKALQDVVPDDVRGQLQSSVSAFLKSEGKTLKLEKLLNINQVPTAIGQKPKNQENIVFPNKNPHIPDPNNTVDNVESNSSTNEGFSAEQNPKVQKKVELTSDGGHEISHPIDTNDTVDGVVMEGSIEDIQALDSQITPANENSSDSSTKNDSSAKLDLKEDNNTQQDVKADTNPTTDQQKTVPPMTEDQRLSDTISSPEAQTAEKEVNTNLSIEEKDVNFQSNSTDPTLFEVSQAFDALTGIDDSTQVAVNSVFGVLENMITQLEEGKTDEAKGEDANIQISDNSEILEENKNKRKNVSIPENSNGNIAGSSNPTMIDHISEEEDRRMRLVSSSVFSQQSNKVGHYYDAPLYVNLEHNNTFYKEYIREYLLMKMQSTKSPDLNTTADLSLDYIPEERQWKLLEHQDVTQESLSLEGDIDEVIEPSYVIMDSDEKQEPFREYNALNDTNEKLIRIDTPEELKNLVSKIILDVLKVEVGRRLSVVNSEDMDIITKDMEEIATAVSMAAKNRKNHKLYSDGNYFDSEKIGTLNGEEIVRAISLSIQETSYLKKMLPLGVIVGSSLASLRIFFNVATINEDYQSEAMSLDHNNLSMRRSYSELNRKCDDFNNKDGEKKKIESETLNNGSVIVGAFSAALGASALLADKQSLQEKGDFHYSDSEEKDKSNLVASFAEKAMSVASPVVPMKEDGEVDQDRLVAMLAGLGQRGGMLKLVGKVALLWGGMRGAMSLTDKLIQFLKISERPLFQRILAFVCMVLVLWSPTIVPLIPTLVQSWGSRDTPKLSQFVCIGGLYASVMILVMLWGKRIRGYKDSIKQYGLDITSPSKIKNYLMGLSGGVLLVLSIHSLNAFLGCVRLSWPSIFLSNPVNTMLQFKVIFKMFFLVAQGIITATGIALVEELLFRSWLPDEIAADFGPNLGIVISGLAFALFQRSALAIPGLWLLSLSLSGVRHRSHGNLSVPIGLRAGIMATSFVLQKGGFLTYKPNFPIWVTGAHPFQPFSDVVGFAFALLLAIFLYPNLHQENKKRVIRE